jgi:hypothetical protein
MLHVQAYLYNARVLDDKSINEMTLTSEKVIIYMMLAAASGALSGDDADLFLN